MSSISVIVPVFNGAPYIRQALNSILRQTFSPCEVLVVDDGSTDETPSILRDFGNLITVLTQTNRGLPAARNRALDVAHGEYIAFLDADDLWSPTFLATVVEAITAQPPTVVGICTGWMYTDRDGNPLPHTRRHSDRPVDVYTLLQGGQFPVHATLTRKTAIDQAGRFDEAQRALEDWDLWLRLTVSGSTFATVQQHLALYRLHGESMSGDPDRMRQGRLRALEKLFGRPDLAPELRSLEPQARAAAHAESSAALYGAGRAEEGQREFVEAVRLWPRVLATDEPYYALVCAEQPVGYKATSYPVDLERAEARLLDALDAATTALGWRETPARRRAWGQAYRVLARCAALQRSRRALLRYARLAAAHDFAPAELLAATKALAKSVTWQPPRAPAGPPAAMRDPAATAGPVR